MTHILVWCASAFSVTVCVQVCVCVQICRVVWPVSDGEFGCVGVCVTACGRAAACVLVCLWAGVAGEYGAVVCRSVVGA